MDFDAGNAEYLETSFAFFGLWQDENKILLASSQSGGSCIHILDLDQSGWKDGFRNIQAEGKLKTILENTDMVRESIQNYAKPGYVRDPLPLYFLEGNPSSGTAKIVADDIRANYDSPVFLNSQWWNGAEDWDRSAMANETYRNKRDARREYNRTQQQVVEFFASMYDEYGIGTWGGHGNDPYYYQLSTHKLILDTAMGRKTVLIFPELEDHSPDFAWVMEDLFYPLAEYAQSRNAQIYVRSKGNFWNGNAHLPMWRKMLDGKYPEVFIPSMEETTNKAVDISIPSRIGIWASGSADYLGHRSVPDNPSFDRSRQYGYQRIPNHFLRHSVYMIAQGATYINNFALNPDYMSVLWNLIAKEALFIPRPNEVLSYSPAHLSMQNPDEHFMLEGSSVKWSVFYDEQFEKNNPFVFSRQNGTWPGAKLTEWDFSRFASGVKDRRQNFLPPTPFGLVLITPPQEGAYASPSSQRGALIDHLHPIYRDIMKEYYTDGRDYYSADGSQQFPADEYDKIIEQDIREKSLLLPLTVEGDAAWVLAQLDETHLRLTLVDNGYLNPDDRIVRVRFHTVTPLSMTDILDGSSFDVSDKANVKVDIPCGLFRFIDIELNAGLP
jgi:hypothetical protein